MSARVETVLGPVPPESIGVTMMHEHLLWDESVYHKPADPNGPEEAFLFRKVCMEDLGKIRYNMHAHRDNTIQLDEAEAAAELCRFRRAGGSAIVDCSCYGIHRDAEAERRISRETGCHVIMATGMYIHGSCPEEAQLSAKEKARLFLRELTMGVGDTGIKAGVIGEIGVSEGFPVSERETLAAAAMAQAETGAAILIHQPGLMKWGHILLDQIAAYGGKTEKTVLCHCDPLCADLDYLKSLLDRGAVLSFDQFGMEFLVKVSIYDGIWLPRDIERVRAISRLCALGYVGQLVVSQDISFKTCFVKYGGHGYAHILENIVPLLRREGVRDEWLRRILRENPARLLTID